MKLTPLVMAVLAASAVSAQEFPGALNYSAVDRAALHAAADSAAVEFKTAADPIAALNAALVEALKPFNNAATRAALTFSKVATNAQRATAVALTLDYSKKGPGGEAGIKIDDLSYSFIQTPCPPCGRGTPCRPCRQSLPTTHAKGAIKLNLLNILTQKQINEFGPGAQKLVEEFVAEKTREFGAAAKVSASVTHQDHDAAGNLVGLGIAIDLDIDTAKLPAGVNPKGVLITAAHAKADIALNGVAFELTVVSNPSASQFDADQQGLKEGLDKLLARDPEILKGLQQAFGTIDQVADQVTKGPAH
ncbi:MAG: hypothetical protein ACHQ49_04000 [Elusimicrobiota bacterium]